MKKKKYSKESISNNYLENKKKRKFMPIIVIIIIFLMVGSTVFVAFLDEEPENNNIIEYNNYKFQKGQQGYTIDYSGIKIGFEYLPNEVKDIMIENTETLGKDTYILFDPDELKEDSLEINRLRSLLSVKKISAFPACIKTNGCSNIPVITCKEAKNYLFIKFKNETKITKEDGCIVMETKDQDSFRIIERFIYNLYGIM